MSCNCKKKAKLEEEYGVPQEESLLDKFNRMVRKVLMFIILVSLFLVVTPVLIGVFIYKAAFSKNMIITLPKFMGKYMK